MSTLNDTLVGVAQTDLTGIRQVDAFVQVVRRARANQIEDPWLVVFSTLAGTTSYAGPYRTMDGAVSRLRRAACGGLRRLSVLVDEMRLA